MDEGFLRNAIGGEFRHRHDDEVGGRRLVQLLDRVGDGGNPQLPGQRLRPRRASGWSTPATRTPGNAANALRVLTSPSIRRR